ANDNDSLALSLLNNTILVPDKIADVISAKLLGYDYRTLIRKSDSDLQKHVAHYRQELAAGNKVILVPHSQGNFYANLSFEELAVTDGIKSHQLSITGVATPTSFIANNGLYVTVVQDFIYKVPGALGPNLSTPGCGSIVDCHGFDRTYLNFNITRE